jgi:hypothetical protein
MGQDGLQRAARDLAARILEFTGVLESMQLSVEDRTGSQPDGAEAVRRELENAFRLRGVHLAAAPEAAAVASVFLAENYRGPLWVADVRTGGNRKVIIMEAPRIATGRGDAAVPLTLEVRPVFGQRLPVLDFVLRGETLTVLDPESVSVRVWKSGGWQVRSSAPLARPHPLPRDVRGRLRLEGGSLQAWLPGLLCTGSTDPLAVSCTESGTPWPLDLPDAGISAGKNYFSPAALPPFYSIAGRPARGDLRWLIAGVDGKTYLYDADRQVLSILDGWGSDVAGVETGCGSGRQVLAVIPGEAGEADSIQAFEVSDRRVLPAGPPARLQGIVTALWPDAEGRSAGLVCRNSQAGGYEAFLVSVSCRR